MRVIGGMVAEFDVRAWEGCGGAGDAFVSGGVSVRVNAGGGLGIMTAGVLVAEGMGAAGVSTK